MVSHLLPVLTVSLIWDVPLSTSPVMLPALWSFPTWNQRKIPAEQKLGNKLSDIKKSNITYAKSCTRRDHLGKCSFLIARISVEVPEAPPPIICSIMLSLIYVRSTVCISCRFRTGMDRSDKSCLLYAEQELLRRNHPCWFL